MFGLREQIHRHPGGVGAAVAHDHNLGGAGNHVDVYLPEHHALGGGDIDIAGADNLVDPGDAVSPVSQRCHGLSAADAKRAIHSGDVRSGQHQIVHQPFRGRHHHDEFTDARDLGRNGVHQHRRRIGGLASRYIQTDAIQRRDLLTKERAVGLGVAPGFNFLPLVITAHARRRLFQSRTLISGDFLRRLGKASFWNLQRRGRGRSPTIEACGVIEQRRIAACAYCTDHFAYYRLNLGI